ncbi:hypothetical protein ACI2UK_24375 [Ralstonia nicotianae]|uniref:hypothetical protein n=1 Tax=Ralstonia pseudosolanacearum TaxID=1310165 RepID=UPI00200393DB|nr:hypothetical protein [Ralstonia pseudosolanacearum]MCK4120421.1 hypothetical protein [Ralstonia pseudosolanacearum]
MYIISTGAATNETRTTMAGVLAFLNADCHRSAPLNVDSIKVHHVERGEIPVVAIRSRRFGLRPDGTVHEVLTRVIDEVDRFIVRPEGKVLRPFEMGRDAWRAVMVAGAIGYEHDEIVDSERLRAGALLSEFAVDNPDRFVTLEFKRRFGFGTNGPEFCPGGSTSTRHELHVAFALQRGEPVRESIVNYYRTWTCSDHATMHWLRPLVEVPALRGALPAEKLRMLCSVTHHEKLPITEHNVSKLVSIMNKLPASCTCADVDDALFAAGILPPHSLPAWQPVEGPDSQPVSELARRIQTLVDEANFACTLAPAIADREKRQMSQRQFDRRQSLAERQRDRGSYAWGNRMALAVLKRDIVLLLDVLDSPRDANTASKQAIKEVLGVNLTSVSAEVRRRSIFALCGFSVEEQAVWEAETVQMRAKAKEARSLEHATKSAEASRWRIEGGKVLNGREYVDLCIAEGFSQITSMRRGSAISYLIENPDRRASRRLRAKDGTLAYARAKLAGVSAQTAAIA